MRLGGLFIPSSTDEIDECCNHLDEHGLSAVFAPANIQKMNPDQCAAFGLAMRHKGLVIGECGFWENLMTQDKSLRAERIKKARHLLKLSDAMGVRCFVTLVGTCDKSDHPLAPHPYQFTKACRAEFRDVVLQILDGMELKTTKYGVEPWCNTFFYQPEDIREFIDNVGHPHFGVHLDQMNMVSQFSFFNTTELINRTFDLLADRAWSIHLKDIAWDYQHMFLKWDEVVIGDGVMDYPLLLERIAKLDPHITCFCEHFSEKRDYLTSFSRLHKLAEVAGVKFLRRGDNE